MKEIAAILSLLSIMFISTTVLANNEYMCKNVTCKDDISGSSDTVYSAIGKARLDINAVSDTTGCNYAKVFVMNTYTGNITMNYNMYAKNTRFFSDDTGKLKAVFRRGSSSPGEMSVDYNFSSVNEIDIKLFELVYRLIRNLQIDTVTGDVYFK
ncbi:MAG: hypothetical protein K2M78_07010 [Lachnospiraceae bacterium]|nr:hypothetical protein [Lachnospiraceae bacterium]